MTSHYIRMCIITRREKLSVLQDALLELGVDGMTVAEVEGSGQQNGQIIYEDEDGNQNIMLIPKVRVTLILTSIDAETILEKILPILRTGKVGDGKIFIQYIEGQIVTARTGYEYVAEKLPQSKGGIFMEPAKKPMTKISIITRREKLEELRKELLAIGITGMTILNVNGCGVQKGLTRIIEGVTKRLLLAPKIQIDIVVCAVPVQTVIDTVLKVVQTGNIGDGKIFTCPIDHVIRIRTGETDAEAL